MGPLIVRLLVLVGKQMPHVREPYSHRALLVKLKLVPGAWVRATSPPVEDGVRGVMFPESGDGGVPGGFQSISTCRGVWESDR